MENKTFHARFCAFSAMRRAFGYAEYSIGTMLLSNLTRKECVLTCLYLPCAKEP